LPYARPKRWATYGKSLNERFAALPEAIKHWSLTSLREKLVKIGAKVVRAPSKVNGVRPAFLTQNFGLNFQQLG
jgi:hypothetical protein